MCEANLDPSENLLQLINRLILEKHYDGIPILLQDKSNCELLKEISFEGIEICKKYLTEECYENNLCLYSCCELLLKAIAEYASQEEVLFELLEIIETTKSDNIFTSVLKAIQICLLRKKEHKTQNFLQWSFDSIRIYITKLKTPNLLSKNYDEQEEKLLEQNDQIQQILRAYITITLFYEPILKDVVNSRIIRTFIDTKLSEKNLLVCFFLQLLNKPLALLSLNGDYEKKEGYSYAFQCAKKLVDDICKLFPDPLYFMNFIEKRIRWKPKKYIKSYIDSNKLSSKNVFLADDRIPITSYGIFYYLLFNEKLLPLNAPKVYHPQYIFESCLYLSVELFNCKESSLQYKGIKLIHEILDRMGSSYSISSDSLNLKIHSVFCNDLIKIIIFSNMERSRINGLKLLEKYILKFDDDGKFILLKNLIKITTHDNLLGYLFVIYKNLIAKKLESNDDNIELNEYYKGNEFKMILLNFICELNNGVETDLMQHSDRIICTLNILRYFAIADKNNKTGFWNFINEIKLKFLEPLRKAIDLSRAHYKGEEYRVRNDKCNDDTSGFHSLFKTLSNDLPELSKERKLSLLASAMITFDLMESLLARVNECIEVHNV